MPYQGDFYARLDAAVAENDSLLCVGLDPHPDRLPVRYRRDNGDTIAGLFAWNQALVETTADLVCAFKPNIAFYESLGRHGHDLLLETIRFIRSSSTVPIILDAKRGDIGSTAQAYASACFEYWDVDAVTLTPYLGRDSVEPFAAYSDKGLFVLCHTSNPGAADFQELEISDWRALDREPHQPLYVHVAKAALVWSPNVGLVVGATFPQAIADIRTIAPDRWLLLPGVGAQGGETEAAVRAGLRPDASGLLVNASRGVALADDHRAAASRLRNTINTAREQFTASDRDRHTIAPAPDAPGLTIDAMSGLIDLGALKFGDFTLASGVKSPFYIDLRLLVSRPGLLEQVAEAYAALLDGLPCDRLAGVPYAALPIATAVSLQSGKPLIYTRKESKTHGLGREIEGLWHPGERVVVVEDLITSGGSIVAAAERLRAAGLTVTDAIVLIDREQGGMENLAAAGIVAHPVIRLSSLIGSLRDGGKLDAKTAEAVLSHIGSRA